MPKFTMLLPYITIDTTLSLSLTYIHLSRLHSVQCPAIPVLM